MVGIFISLRAVEAIGIFISLKCLALRPGVSWLLPPLTTYMHTSLDPHLLLGDLGGGQLGLQSHQLSAHDLLQ